MYSVNQKMSYKVQLRLILYDRLLFATVRTVTTYHNTDHSIANFKSNVLNHVLLITKVIF